MDNKLTPEMQAKVETLVNLITSSWKAEILRRGWNWENAHERNHTAHYHVGKKYIRIDTGDSGRYMIEIATGAIYGIKAYGVIHRGHFYGTLDTLDNWHWGNYTAVRKVVKNG
jgi:hypothetical protein